MSSRHDHVVDHTSLPCLVSRNWRLGFLLLLSTLSPATEAPPAKNIVMLYSFADRSVNSSVEFLKSEVRSHVTSPANFYVEYLETTRFEDPDYDASVAATLHHAFGGEKFDLVIVDAFPALSFAIRHRNELFPGVPIVFMSVHQGRIQGIKMWPGVTGVTLNVDVGATLALALRLHPDTKSVAVVTNTSEFERYWLAAVKAELARFRNTIQEIELVGLPTEQLLERVSTLPPRTIVLFQASPEGASQPQVGAFEMVSKIGQRLPTYCIFAAVCLDHGGVGGVDLDFNEQTTVAATLAGRVLSGEPPENIPVVKAKKHRILVDWRQLRYWKIPVSALPPGTILMYQELTPWERNKKYIIPAIALFIAQTLLIVALLWHRARKRNAEAHLRESEKRFRVMADTTPSLIWMCDPAGEITYLNDRRISFTGSNSRNGHGDSWTEFVHPDDLLRLLESKFDALRDRQPFSTEYRLRRRDGVYRWMFDVASPRVNGDGSFAGFIGSAIDVTDQKLAQDALEKVSGRLIEAQEKERLRIARELHDDICQRLALLSMELDQADRSVKGHTEESKRRLHDIRNHCAEIASDVQSLSHQLHSSKLDCLGLEAAVKGFCKEFAGQHEVIVNFKHNEVPRHLSKDASLCLFRIAQEALHNAVKYSGVKEFSVELNGSDTEVQLEIRDFGTGFDEEEAKQNRGLGLVSMQERVHLVHGKFHIDSAIGSGTRVTASIPIAFLAPPNSGYIADDQSSSAEGMSA